MVVMMMMMMREKTAAKTAGRKGPGILLCLLCQFLAGGGKTGNRGAGQDRVLTTYLGR